MAAVPGAGLGVGFAAILVPDFAAAAFAAVADFDAVDLADVDFAAVDLVELEVDDFDAVADFVVVADLDDVLAFAVDAVAARVDCRPSGAKAKARSSGHAAAQRRRRLPAFR